MVKQIEALKKQLHVAKKPNAFASVSQILSAKQKKNQ